MLPETIPQTIDELKKVLATSPKRLMQLIYTDKPRAPGKWSRRQILGHLIDSAANNHQRFVRAAIHGEVTLPGYEQDRWVDAQGYQDQKWDHLVNLWWLYNSHLLHVIERFPADKLRATCRIGSYEPMTIDFVIRDYVRHMEHHLDQILGA